MAVIFMDGFDNHTLDDLTKWLTAGTAVGPEYAFGVGKGMYLSSQAIYANLPASYTTLIAGGYFKYAETSFSVSYFNRFLCFREGTTEHFSVRNDSSGRLTATRDGTVLDTSVGAIPLNAWFHLEVKATIHDSTGLYEVRINGVTVISGSSKDTRNGGTGVINNLYILGSNTACELYVDDIYVIDPSTGTPNNFIGPSKIFTSFPIASGTKKEFTPRYFNDNYMNVCDTKKDAVFNYTSGSNVTDTFKMSPMTSGSVIAIQAKTFAKQDLGAAKKIANQIFTTGSSIVSTGIALGTSYSQISNIYHVDPDGEAWTAENIEDAEFGYGIVP